jgi:hypothetical protein
MEERPMKKEITKFVRESVEWLQQEQQGCCTYKLDDHLAVCVGWSAGYGEEERDDVIQAKDNLDYGINVGIKVWTSDAYMLTDFDWINFPYYDDGEVLDMSLGIAPNEDYERIADSLLKWYDEVKNIVLDDKGRILQDDRYDYN